MITRSVVTCTEGQPPEAAIVYFAVRDPGLLKPRLMAPVVALMERSVPENTPPVTPVKVTFAVPPLLQNGEPA